MDQFSRRQINDFPYCTETRILQFMQNDSKGDNLHEMLNLVCPRKMKIKYFKMSSAKILTEHVKR